MSIHFEIQNASLPFEIDDSSKCPTLESTSEESGDPEAKQHLTEHISFRHHLKDVFRITYPIILSEIFQNILPIMDIAFVGQLNKHDLAAASLATIWFNLWHASMMGFMTAIDTVLAQSYGASQYDSFSIWTSMSLVIVFVVTFLISGLVALCGPVMHLIGHDPALADAAGKFSYRLIPGLFPYYLFKVLTKYLQTQNKPAPGIWIGVLASGMNALFNWALIFEAGWGLSGAPWATTLTRTIEFLLIVGYLRFSKSSLQATWPKFSKEDFNFKSLKPFWKLAISGTLSVSAATWSFEIASILAGLIGVVALDAHIITLSICNLNYLSVPLGIGIAASIRVGQLIGENRPKDAEQTTRASFLLGAVGELVLSITLFFCKDIVGDLFSNDEEVSNLVSVLIPILCLYMVGEAILEVVRGTLRGLGRQKLILLMNVLGFWVCSIPIGAVLTFVVGLGVNGLWWGFNIGYYTATAIGIWFLRTRIDWEKEAKKAVLRLSTLTSSRKRLSKISMGGRLSIVGLDEESCYFSTRGMIPEKSKSPNLEVEQAIHFDETEDDESSGTDCDEIQIKTIVEPEFDC